MSDKYYEHDLFDTVQKNYIKVLKRWDLSGIDNEFVSGFDAALLEDKTYSFVPSITENKERFLSYNYFCLYPKDGRLYRVECYEDGKREYLYNLEEENNSLYYKRVLEGVYCGHYGLPYWTSDGSHSVKNNDGRNTCFKCGKPTKIVAGFYLTNVYNVCDNSRCEWFLK